MRGERRGDGVRVRIPEIGLRPVALRLYMFHMNRGLRRSALAHHHLPFFNHSLARLEGRDGRVARGLYLRLLERVLRRGLARGPQRPI